VTEPRAERPGFPAGYGISEAPTEAAWADAVTRLDAARNYWVVTTRPDGRPHAMPVWGLWLDDAVVFSTDPDSRKGRNLAARPELVVHLESGDDVVILEGRAQVVTDDALLRRFSDAYFEKYGWRVEPGPGFGIYALRPRVAYTWRERDFPETATRWMFPSSG
jgi:PPOX class probable F420-dependent enzyme